MEEKNFSTDDQYIKSILEKSHSATSETIHDILDRAERFEGLNHEDVAILLQTNDPEHLKRIFSIAGAIKQRIYGDRIVLFAPLYVSDYCVNRCDYCGFRHDNTFERRKLNMDEVRSEVAILEKMGHKRLALEAGEDPVHCSIDYVLECIRTIYDMKADNGEIRRVNVNIAATSIEHYKRLHDAGIGTYILFQETYHKETYESLHLAGPKKDYEYHSTAFDRAMQAGIEDVGAGVLFGFYDYRYEILALMMHNEHLEKKFGVGFHTISVPRICQADGTDSTKYKHIVSDDDFEKIVAIIRIAVPYTGMIVSTRESADMRKKLIRIGVSQLSGGSSVEVGGYAKQETKGTQFAVSDDRSARDIIDWLMQENLVPSFCTACYRKCRTGDRFMRLAKTGNIKNVCLPNALMSLKEYALDYGDVTFKAMAETIIETHLPTIENEEIAALTQTNLQLLAQGKRDLYI